MWYAGNVKPASPEAIAHAKKNCQAFFKAAKKAFKDLILYMNENADAQSLLKDEGVGKLLAGCLFIFPTFCSPLPSTCVVGSLPAAPPPVCLQQHRRRCLSHIPW